MDSLVSVGDERSSVPFCPQPGCSVKHLRVLCFEFLRRRALLTVFCFFFLAVSELILHGHSILIPISWTPHSREPSFSLSSPRYVALSKLETGLRATPDLNLEEDANCLFTGTVPDNLEGTVEAMTLKPTQWVEHKGDKVSVQHSLYLRARKIAAEEHQFILTFKLPNNLTKEGKATITLKKSTEGLLDLIPCAKHVIVVTRLSDDKHLQGRSPSSETNDVVEFEIQRDNKEYTGDLGPLVYGKDLQGKNLHLLFREANDNCLSAFSNPATSESPKLEVNVLGTGSEDAVYGEWSPFSSCRVSCVTSVNYQCRKRDCKPGSNKGSPCKMESMIDKKPCSDANVSTPCTCEQINQQNACPALSKCDESLPNNVKCTCGGQFTRNSVKDKTTCDAAAVAGGPNAESSEGSTLKSSAKLIWIVIGVFCLICLCGCFLLVCVKKRKPREEDLLNARIPPPPREAHLGAGPMLPPIFAADGMGPSPFPPIMMGSQPGSPGPGAPFSYPPGRPRSKFP